jgi:hypothetical protein
MSLNDCSLQRFHLIEPSQRRLPVRWLKAQLDALLLAKIHRFERFEHSTAVNSFDLAHGNILKLLT